MISDTERLVVNELRKNSRERFKSIAESTGLHKLTVANIHDRLLDRGVIRTTSIIDSAELGFPVQASMVFHDITQSNASRMSPLIDRLGIGQNINHMHLLDGGESMFTEGAFMTLNDMHDFKEQMEENGFELKKEYHIIDKLEDEKFQL